MVTTHCLTSGSLGSSELPVHPINSYTTLGQSPGAGPYRGVVVVLHGLVQSATNPVPFSALADSSLFGVGSGWGTLSGTLNTDGWVCLQVPLNGDNYNGTPSFGISSDINASGNGSRYRTNISHWWAHVLTYCASTYGPSWPVIPFGSSWGGLHALIVAQDYTSKPPPAVGINCPATIISNLSSSLWAGNTISNSTGLDVSTTALNSYTGVSHVSYGTSDSIVGWSASSSPAANTDSIITNAVNAGRSCTRLATHYTLHGFDTTDAASIQTWFTNTVDPLCPKTLTIGS